MNTVRIMIVATSLLAAQGALAGVDCQAIEKAADKRESIIPGYQSGRDVVGKGRAPFYSAPDRRCAIKGVFLVPRDTVTAYAEVDGFTQVMYINLKTGEDTEGWLESSRLRVNGTGISPRQ